MREFRTYIHVRPKGGHPADITELRTEHYDNYEQYAEAIKHHVLEIITRETNREGEI